MHLKKFKLKHGNKVALVMENSFIFLPILFGIWKAGLVAVPINAKLHKKELSWIFNNSEAKLVFCSKSKAPDIETNLPVIVTFSKDFKVHTQHEHQIDIKTDISDSAWIFYTSGTTGTPKGVMLTHGNLTANIKATLEAQQFERNEIFLSFLPLFYFLKL